jgi:hypothetical protein
MSKGNEKYSSRFPFFGKNKLQYGNKSSLKKGWLCYLAHFFGNLCL